MRVSLWLNLGVCPQVTTSAVQILSIDTTSPIQVPFKSNTSSSRKAIASLYIGNDGFTTAISKAKKRRVIESLK